MSTDQEPTTTFEERVGARWNRIPRRARLTLVVAVVGGASFGATILPFVVADHAHSTVEIAGRLPVTATVNVPLAFDIAADNTGGGSVQPLCVKVTSDHPVVTGLSAIFQGLDHVAATGDRVCGGTLSGSETTSIHLQFTPATAGAAQMRLVITQGDTEIGPARNFTLLVSG